MSTKFWNPFIKSVAIIAILLQSFNIFSQLPNQSRIVEQPVWKYRFNTTEITAGETVELILTTDAPKGWYIYSTSVNCEIGPIKANIIFEENSTFQLVGKLYSIGDKKEYDKSFECPIGKFEKKAEVRQKIKILAPNPVIKGFLEGQMCNNSSGICVQLITPDFNFSGLKVVGKTIVIPSAKTLDKVDKTDTDQVNLKSDGSDCDDNKALLKRLNQIYGPAEPEIDHNEEPYEPTYIYKAKSEEEIGTCEKKNYEGDIGGIPKSSLIGFFILAFLSGLAALITPCVFPMIPMTVAFFMKGKTDKKNSKSIANGFAFGISIILIYTVVGSFVGITFGPDAANFIATHWIPNVFFFLIFVLFAAAFFGAFELVLPSWIVSKVDKQADKGGMMGIFFMALTLVLVSFSCTGPIVGIVIVESISGEFIKPIVGMFGFSLAFAIPFALFAMFPGWLNKLPKSGGWLNAVKVSLGFIELALGLKFLSLADQTHHWGILDREVYIALWIVIFTLMGIYLLGKIKFAHDSEMKYLKVPRLLIVISVFSFVAYLIPGMFGAPLKGLAGYLPPMSTHDFPLFDKLSGSRGTICEEPKYNDKLHLPHNLLGYFDYEQGMACAKKLNKPVFIDFTGHGCVNCREMEARVWSDERVLEILSKEYIIIALYVDDKEIMLEPEEQFVSKINGKKINSLSRKNSDIQSCMFGSNGQPGYILIDHDEELLNYPQAYDLNVAAFIKFLRTGVRNYKEKRMEEIKNINVISEENEANKGTF